LYYFQPPILVEKLGNFEPESVPLKAGPGEGGKPHVLRDDQQNDVSSSLSEYGMNMACSDEISLDRVIPDLRLPEYVNILLFTLCFPSKHFL
jgi:polypeptide N-acetylgalactosaminyltransferase